MNETWKIVTSVNPIYYAISPISMAFRTIHCLPILLKPKQRDWMYNKYKEKALPCDVTFHEDSYSSFQFVQYHFRHKDFLHTIHYKLHAWSRKNFHCDAIIITRSGSAKQFVMKAVKMKPSVLIGQSTHLFVLFPETSEFIGFLDHYYCDGIILFDLFKHLFEEINFKLPFPKYNYYPVFSDALAAQYIASVTYDNCVNPSLITQYDKTRILSRIVKQEDSPYWNRWFNYAMNVLPIFECTKGLRYARVALSVGIDADSTFGNNRIGAIIVLITRPPKSWTYKTKIMYLMEQFETQVTKNYKDCITTYDIARSYNTSLLRKIMSTKLVDIFITSMFVPVKIAGFDYALGAFVGNHYDYPFFYVNSMTVFDECSSGFTTNWKQFNHKKYVSDFDAKLMYTFD